MPSMLSAAARRIHRLRAGSRLTVLLAATAATGALAGGLGAAPALAAAPTYNLQGTWTTGYTNGGAREPQNGTWDITSMDMSTGNFSGTAVVSGTHFVMQGNESGSTATDTLTDGSYVAYDMLALSVLPDGNVGGNGGTFGTGGSYTGGGTFWAELGPTGVTTTTTTTTSGATLASATVVTCNAGPNPGDPFDCTATVADASGSVPAGTPTGTVTFSATSGGSRPPPRARWRQTWVARPSAA